MELKKKVEQDDEHYYLVVFTNGKEYYVIDSERDVLRFIAKMENKGHIMGTVDPNITLQWDSHEPIYIQRDRLFSVQKQKKQGVIGAHTRLWKLVLK